MRQKVPDMTTQALRASLLTQSKFNHLHIQNSTNV